MGNLGIYIWYYSAGAAILLCGRFDRIGNRQGFGVAFGVQKGAVPDFDPDLPGNLGSDGSLLRRTCGRYFLRCVQQLRLSFYYRQNPAQTRADAGRTIAVFLKESLKTNKSRLCGRDFSFNLICRNNSGWCRDSAKYRLGSAAQKGR